MRTVLVIFGGSSTEHDISIITGVEALNAMPIKGYRVIPIYIKDKIWYTGRSMYEIKSFIHFVPSLYERVSLIGNNLYVHKKRQKLVKIAEIDCALLATHGGDGENGGLQGFLEQCGVPHTASSVRECAICMDKVLTKLVLEQIGVQTVKGRSIIHPQDVQRIEEVQNELGYPLIVKPASQGSSIGITLAKNRKELDKGIELAAMFGNVILIEQALTDFIEINSAAVTIDDKLVLSEIEKPLTANDFLTYNDKYMGSGSGKGMSGGSREFPARISPEIRQKVQDTTKTVYNKLNLKGVVRIDYLLKNDQLYLNEINTIPGSLSHYLFNKISHPDLLKGMVEQAIANGIPQNTVFKTEVLSNIGAKHK